MERPSRDPNVDLSIRWPECPYNTEAGSTVSSLRDRGRSYSVWQWPSLRSHTLLHVSVAARVCALSGPALCDPVNGSPAGSFALGIFQARILEWVAMSSSRGSSDPGIRFESPASPALAAGFFTTEPLGKPLVPRVSSFQHRRTLCKSSNSRI